MDVLLLTLVAVVIAGAGFAITRLGGSSVGSSNDPIADADKRMSYGLYDEAEKTLVLALAEEPSRTDLMFKLLEVYFVWGRAKKFEDAAERFHGELGSTQDWKQVRIMGMQILPKSDLFK